MSKFIVELVLILSAGQVLAQGSYPYANYPLSSLPLQLVPNTSYYPVMPYTYPAYSPGMQTYYPLPNMLQPYPYAAYPSLQPQLAGVAPTTSMQSYTYTSPYNPHQAAMPGPKPASAPQAKQETKPWGDTRYIWPDFYTDQTADIWDKMINAPHDLGYMPGGWRFPSFSSPDPVTVGDAVANQVPPIMEEVPNFMNFTN